MVVLQQTIATKGRGILAMDESNATCGKRLDSIGLENTEDNRRTYRELLISTPGLGEFISGAILFEETLYQSDKNGTSFVDLLNKQNIVPGALSCTAMIWLHLVFEFEKFDGFDGDSGYCRLLLFHISQLFRSYTGTISDF